MDHTSFFKLSEEQIIYQIKTTNVLIEEITNKPTLFFRAPYEETNQEINSSILNNLNMQMTNNTLYSMDTIHKDSSLIFNQIYNNLENCDVVVLHDFNPDSIKAVELLLINNNNEFQFVTYSTLISS